MFSRRDFIKQTAAVSAAGLVSVGIKEQNILAMGKASDVNRGNMSVPDTIDLVHHAKLALNGMLGSIDTNRKDHEIVFLNILDTNPAYMLHWSTMVSGVQPKYIEALPLLRLMSGSDYGMQIQDGFVKAMLDNMSEDGLVYDRVSPDRPWNTGVFYGKKDWDEDYANMAGNGRLLAGLTYWYQSTKEDTWKKLAKKTAEKLYELAIVEGDKAWYPNPGLGNDFSYPRKSGWTTKEPPQKGTEGFEGASMFYHCNPLRGFVRYYQMTGDERFLELSRKFAKFIFEPKFWTDPGRWSDRNISMYPEAAFQRGHFLGHFHAILAAVRSMLDYALIANDRKIIDWANNCYVYAKQMGISKIGIFTGSGAGQDAWGAGTEGCTIADMIGLAVTLTDAGIGDYYDDIEQYAVNGLINAQATDLAQLQRVSLQGKTRTPYSDSVGEFDSRFSTNNKGALPGQEITENVLERSMGAFGHITAARYLTPMMMHCCTANCSQSIYYAWEAILRCSGTKGSVNMWMNRRSANLDVFSSLPFEGKLLLKNKGLKAVSIRKPAWALSSQIKCTIDGKSAEPVWFGNRLNFSNLKGNETISLYYPVAMNKAEHILLALNGQNVSCGKYECHCKGNIAVKVERTDPGVDTQDRNWYRIFRRDNMLVDKTPMKAVDEYIPPQKVINWQVI